MSPAALMAALAAAPQAGAAPAMAPDGTPVGMTGQGPPAAVPGSPMGQGGPDMAALMAMMPRDAGMLKGPMRRRRRGA
jgi:hypothetical protein